MNAGEFAASIFEVEVTPFGSKNFPPNADNYLQLYMVTLNRQPLFMQLPKYQPEL